MSKEKQIDEMAKDIASTQIGTVKPDLTYTELGEVYKNSFIMRIAKHLYNAGYRKQSEGEWVYHECVSSYDGAESGYSCSVCCIFIEEEVFERCDYPTEFCPKCGAKMKGGE